MRKVNTVKYSSKGTATRGRSYSDEYKENVIQLAINGDRTPRQVAKDLGIPPRTLYTWLQVRGLNGSSGRPADAPRPVKSKEDEVLALRAKVAELEREKRILEEDREILKKATAFFAKEQQ